MDWVVLAMPLLFWAKATCFPPYVKTYRRWRSAALAITAGALMFAALRLDQAAFPFLFWPGVAVVAAMFVMLFWAPSRRPQNGG